MRYPPDVVIVGDPVVDACGTESDVRSITTPDPPLPPAVLPPAPDPPFPVLAVAAAGDVGVENLAPAPPAL